MARMRRRIGRTAQGQAAMITRMDRHVGELLAQVKQLGLDERTLVIFTSDNGPHKEAGLLTTPTSSTRTAVQRHQTQPDRRRHPRAVSRALAGADQGRRHAGRRRLLRRHNGHLRRTGRRKAALAD